MSEQAQALDTNTGSKPEVADMGKDIGSPESERTFKADRENRPTDKNPRKGRERDDGGKFAADKPDKTPRAGGDAAPAADGEAPKAWEGPGYTKRWREGAKKAAEFLASNPEFEQHWKALQEELDPTYSYIGHRDKVLNNYQKRFDPLNDMLTPYEQQWRLSGMSVQQGLGQLLAYQDALSRDPDSTLPQLAAMFKPKDAAKVIQALSQAWGADLGQVAQSAPYVDPQVQQMVNPLVQKLQALEQQNWQREQAQVQEQQNWILNQVNAFEQAVDEKGNRKHPHFREIFVDMVAMANAMKLQGMQPNIDDIFQRVSAYHPAAAEWRAKQGADAALAAASRQNETSKQAQEASRNISGSKANGRDKDPTTLREAMRLADKQLGYTSG